MIYKDFSSDGQHVASEERPPSMPEDTVEVEIRGKAIKYQEFYSEVHGKVCTTKNLISGHKMAP